MDLQQLLELGDRIGYVNTGLKGDEIGRCISKIKLLSLGDLLHHFTAKTDGKCSICQVSLKNLHPWSWTSMSYIHSDIYIVNAGGVWRGWWSRETGVWTWVSLGVHNTMALAEEHMPYLQVGSRSPNLKLLLVLPPSSQILSLLNCIDLTLLIRKEIHSFWHEAAVSWCLFSNFITHSPPPTFFFTFDFWICWGCNVFQWNALGQNIVL